MLLYSRTNSSSGPLFGRRSEQQRKTDDDWRSDQERELAALKKRVARLEAAAGVTEARQQVEQQEGDNGRVD